MTHNPRWQAANGTPLHMRHVRTDDTERLRLALGRLSPEARRQRFEQSQQQVNPAGENEPRTKD